MSFFITVPDPTAGNTDMKRTSLKALTAFDFVTAYRLQSEAASDSIRRTLRARPRLKFQKQLVKCQGVERRRRGTQEREGNYLRQTQVTLSEIRQRKRTLKRGDKSWLCRCEMQYVFNLFHAGNNKCAKVKSKVSSVM